MLAGGMGKTVSKRRGTGEAYRPRGRHGADPGSDYTTSIAFNGLSVDEKTTL